MLNNKLAVYKAVSISVLLYGCRSWTPYRQHIRVQHMHICWRLPSSHP